MPVVGLEMPLRLALVWGRDNTSPIAQRNQAVEVISMAAHPR
jgi:hypothetical protein